MTNNTKEKLDKLKGRDLSKLNKQEITLVKNYFKNMFEHLLPYTAKNGVRFSGNGVSLVTNYGIVFADNSYAGNDSYGFIMRHIETAGDGSIAYDCSTRVSSISEGTLESFSKVIEANIRRNAERAIASFK